MSDRADNPTRMMTDAEFRAWSTDPIEAERCPACGTPGIRITGPGPAEQWACPRCDQ